MKKYQSLIALVLIYCAIPASVYAQTDNKEVLTVPLTTPGKPGFLQVGVMKGSISVVGYAGQSIIIEAVAMDEGRENTKKPETVNGMKRLSPTGGGIELTAEEDKNNVKINVSVMRKPVNLTIKVPQQFSLKVSAINDGKVTIDNVQGELEITNINGAIELNNVSGSAVANTVNGDVKATFKSISDSPMAFSTLNGNLDVTFPAIAKFDVKLKSDRGEIFTDYDVAVQKTQPKSSTVSEKGMYKISREDWVQGKINGGGGEVMMKNMNGNIYVRKAK
jgi:hypothetical protein